MRKQFRLNTEPHVAELGDVELLFKPEVMGDEFMDAYTRLQEAQTAVGSFADVDNIDPAQLGRFTTEMRLFLARLMLPESAAVFAQWDVMAGTKKVGSYGTPEEAEEAAAARKGAKVVETGMRLPVRVLVELAEWAAELYGGGSRPTGSSTGSAQASPNPGRHGRAASRSKASTSTRGR